MNRFLELAYQVRIPMIRDGIGGGCLTTDCESYPPFPYVFERHSSRPIPGQLLIAAKTRMTRIVFSNLETMFFPIS